MAISQLSHSVCIDCSENLYTITDTSSGTVTAPISAETLTITDPNSNVSVINLYASGETISGGSFVVSESDLITPTQTSLLAATLNWTAANTTVYSFYLVYLNSGVPTSILVSFTSDANATDAEIGAGIVLLVTALTGTTGVSASYSSGASLSLSGTSFGITSLSNLTSLSESTALDQFTDGKYNIHWSLTDADAAYNSVTESYFLCNVECCVRGKMSAIDVDCDCTGDKATDAAIESMLMLQGIKAAAACGKDAKADKLLVGLQAICNNDCKSC